jgi:type IV pilus assembly protein PilA
MKKSSIKAFTLIELLVVVAIIGILAAVGVVSFGGFTGSAKTNSTKSNHAAAIKSISAEIKKCEIQGGNLSLKSSTPPSSTSNNVACSKATTSTAALATAFINHLNNESFKNPYDTAQGAFNSTGTTTGQTIITVSGSTITLTTRYLESDGTTVTVLTGSVTDERG